MSNTTDITDQLNSIILVNTINKIFTQSSLGFALVMGNFGSILNCIILSRSIWRKNPCSMYFIACSFSQFLTFDFALVTRMLYFGYNIRTYNNYLWYCKVRYYLTFVSIVLPRYFLILASIDRYLASSRNALRRRWSSPRMALRLIILNTIFWSFMYSHVLIFYTNENGQCAPQSYTYDIVISSQYTIDSSFLALLLMIIFGRLTYRNLRQIKRTIQTNSKNRMSRKDVQLMKMLINQICFFVILSMPLPFYFVYQMVTYNYNKSPFRLTVELFIDNAVHCLVYIEHSFTFLINVLTSPLFRLEFQRVILVNLCRLTRTQSAFTKASSRIHGRGGLH